MKVVVAIDSFKGSMSSLEAGHAVRVGIQRVMPDAEVVVRPLADGGEGTVEALALGMGGQLETICVTGPLGEPVEATYGIVPHSAEGEAVAIIEMSAAAGITLVPKEERNPLHTTTYGVGEMIRDAIGKGCRRFIVGIGGSATNDGGIGMLQALGFDVLNAAGKPVSMGAKGLAEIACISDEKVIPELRACSFKVACDVTNPLCGPQGCSAVFGPQKGATPEMIRAMDGWMARYAKVPLLSLLNGGSSPADDISTIPGTGAAGGLGFAFLRFLQAKLESGIRIVLEETHLEDYVREADLVITGEGRLDSQTVMGKAPIGVAEIAKKHGKRVVAFAGCVTSDAGVCNEHGIDAFFPILRSVVSQEEAMQKAHATENMSATVEQVFRLLR